MTLIDIINEVCATVGVTEEEDKTQARAFLKSLHSILWRKALWRDALISKDFTITANDTSVLGVGGYYLAAKGILVLPAIFETVMAARVTSNTLVVQNQEAYFRVDVDMFEQTGTAAYFHPLEPCVVEFKEAQSLSLLRGTDGDSGATVYVDTLDSDKVTVERNTILMSSAVTSIGSTERIAKIVKPATSAPVYLLNDSQTGTCTFTNASTLNTYEIASASAQSPYGSPRIQVDPGQTVTFVPNTWLDIWILNDSDPTLIWSVPGGSEFVGDVTWTPSGSGDETPGGGNPAHVTYTSGFLTLSATDLNAPERQRIRLVTIPSGDTVLKVLGRRTPPIFEQDGDTPGVTGSENLLIALLTARMYRYIRQNNKAAQVMESDVPELFQSLVTTEEAQKSSRARMIPSDGFGSTTSGFGRVLTDVKAWPLG